ncbi:MAG: ATP-binding protein [Gammaproteobacteria bacterium]|nr:MAG: ATP-binding protein [Gammaproteobacteria bacterium]
MLIEFNVSNFRSILDRQTFSMTKAAGGEHVDSNTFHVDVANKFDLVRSAAIYGANAAGKSNLLLAIDAMSDIVKDSATKITAGDKLPVEPFLLCPEARKSPSEFEVTFISEGVRYQYGFAASKEKIEEEWLLAYPNGRPQQWFSRAWDEKKGKYSWEIGSALTGEKQLWQKSTRDNALFLSTAVQLNSEQLKPVFGWFESKLHVGSVSGWGAGFSASMFEDADNKVKMMNFLKAADLDIQDVKIESEVFDEKNLPSEMPDEVKKIVLEQLKGQKIYEITTYHEDRAGDLIPFKLTSESDGTQKLFSFVGPWLDTLKNGDVLFVDELHDNLHPKLVTFLINLFHSDKTNPNNAQLVFTTHETSILSQEVFRRDQIWFCEKEGNRATTIFPLTDFSPRKGRENLEAAYLSGRYGALPYIRPLKRAS